MEITTRRFGVIEVNEADVLRFPTGLWGLDECRKWVLLADAGNDALAWLQSLDRPETALAVVSPRRFVPDYRLRVARRELAPLELDALRDARVLAIVGTSEGRMTLDLKAPLVINIQRRLGRQVIANGDLSIQHPLPVQPAVLRRSA